MFKSSQGVMHAMNSDLTASGGSMSKTFLPQKRQLPPRANENRSNPQIEMIHKSKFSMQKGTS